MTDQVWNNLCDEVSQNKGIAEIPFEKEVAKDLLSALGWNRLKNNLKEQYVINKQTKWRFDFALFIKGKDKPEIVVELKRPDHKQQIKDYDQISSYMKVADSRFGLYFGEKLELFYLMIDGEEREARSILTVDYKKDSNSGNKLFELLRNDTYDREKLISFCEDQLRLSYATRYWNSEEGKEKLISYMAKESKLGAHLLADFRSLIGSPIKKSSAVVIPSPIIHHTAKPSKDNKIWLMCYDKKFFDVEGCFKKLGQVYWTQASNVTNVQKGDIAYLYSSSPESAIRFKVEVIDSQLPYSPEMDVEDEFSKTGTSNSEGNSRYYFLVRPIAETHSDALKLFALQANHLLGGRPATTNLSQDKYKALRIYIEQHFEDADSSEASVPQDSPMIAKSSKKVAKPKAKKARRAPFNFSMVGLKDGDIITFAPSGINVRVIGGNKIDYENRIFTLSGFCKEYMPVEGSELREYQGPAHFTFKGKTLDEIRKERE